ncbi:hypothetical protein DICVIV_00640 [Dictyocaulus viviparus]|uniref:Uncharacterized protein n=1 Tax=Dictyocaulus viviparus TaxID=29172 RepID=A0A0D8YAA8_DICVI|nr:hypothetical protein DICVIV_00640 [Dictyocaulus viviparus]
MAHQLFRSSDEDSEQYTNDDTTDIERAFSELSSYYSDMTSSSSEITSSDIESSHDTSKSCDDEETTNFETDDADDTSDYSTHSSDTSFQLSTLIEETNREKLAEFVRLRPADQQWIRAAWTYFDAEPTYRRNFKAVKVARKMRSDLKPKNNWTELYREYFLRHPLNLDSKSIDELKRLSFDAPFLPLPDLTV